MKAHIEPKPRTGWKWRIIHLDSKELVAWREIAPGSADYPKGEAVSKLMAIDGAERKAQEIRDYMERLKESEVIDV